MNERIYVCHTYYHVYVTVLKELALPLEKQGQATLVLSKLSTDFENLKDRVLATGFFQDVIEFDEKRDTFFPQLAQYRVEQGNIVKNMIARIRFTKLYARLEEPYIPVDFKKYQDIYVYCDSDPIGYYLNAKHIYYHALEDGLNCIKNLDGGRYDNRGHFQMKLFFAKLNLIFIQNGYSKYCLDMEVNDLEPIRYKLKNMIEVSRQSLVERLTAKDKELILKMFVRDMEALLESLAEGEGHKKKILILTDPLCDLKTREQIFKDIAAEYEQEGQVYIKQHPRDELDYRSLFSQYPIIDGTVPMEMLNFIPGIHFHKVVAVLTEIKAIQFADETIRLGIDFMDRYEDPLIHRQNEQI